MVSKDPRRKPALQRLAQTISMVLAAGIGLSGPALAQPGTPASNVTPETFQPPLQKLNGAIVFSGATSVKAPPGADAIAITLSGVDLRGGLAQLATANAALKTRLTGKRIPVSELFDAVAALEESYANAGYVLVRVVLPQQALRDGGVLKVDVVNGFVEAVDRENVPPEVQQRIDRLTAPLVNRKGLTLAELERQLLLAGDIAGVALGTALGVGQLPGGTVLTLDPEYQRITGFVGFDNFADDDLGPVTLNAGVEFNSVMGLGETLYLRASGAPYKFFSSDPRYRVLAAGALVPLGTSGLALNGEVTVSHTTPDDDIVPTQSQFDRQSLRLIYPWIRSRQMNLTTQLALDRQQDSQDLIAGAVTPIYDDKTTVLRAGASLNYQHGGGAYSDVGAVLSKGIDALGARTLADVGAGTPLSRQGADATFTKLSFSGFHQRPLTRNLILSVTARGQVSFGDALLTAEQFGLAGPREISAFDSGDLRGDSGWVLRAELAHQAPGTLGKMPVMFSPYVFLAAGGVTIEQPTILEHGHENAQAYGIGLDLFSQTESRFRASSLRLEMAKGERDYGPDETRFSISGNFRF
ncbi:ShlB/FhaC/HecB family hemolysin secretion/activation protein [Phaeovulum sp.]|uniref:ShlB/FhaC/HecB family hemolysin secretion/activation protein n=1 Tax=Phaeovulum sp. TaxID=2934796 RepID=UPI0039E2E818